MPKRMRTIKYAVRDLPKDCQLPILRAWKHTGCMDLYDGNLYEYLTVIAHRLERTKDELKRVQKIVDDVHRLIKF